MNPILLFDIDGTLLHVQRSFMREVLHTLLKEFGLNESAVSGMSFAGRTDRDIFNDITVTITDETDKQKDLFSEIKEAYLGMLLNELTSDDIDVIDGASDMVQAAAEKGIDIGLCTGNFREAAHKKIEAAGFNNLFFFGGFGCDHADRKHLPEAAHQEYIAFSGSVPERDAYIIIGDTPNDVRSANYFGARSVAVTTGGFSPGDFLEHQPGKVVKNLRELIPICLQA